MHVQNSDMHKKQTSYFTVAFHSTSNSFIWIITKRKNFVWPQSTRPILGNACGLCLALKYWSWSKTSIYMKKWLDEENKMYLSLFWNKDEFDEHLTNIISVFSFLFIAYFAVTTFGRSVLVSKTTKPSQYSMDK